MLANEYFVNTFGKLILKISIKGIVYEKQGRSILNNSSKLRCKLHIFLGVGGVTLIQHIISSNT